MYGHSVHLTYVRPLNGCVCVSSALCTLVQQEKKSFRVVAFTLTKLVQSTNGLDATDLKIRQVRIQGPGANANRHLCSSSRMLRWQQSILYIW